MHIIILHITVQSVYVLLFLTQTSACLQTLFEAFQYIITAVYYLFHKHTHAVGGH